MPDIRRSSVDLPAPLCPIRPTRSPWRNDRVTSCSASTTGTLASVPILPPARPTVPSTAFFSDLVFASKMGNSTLARRTSMETMSLSHPVRDSGPVVAQDDQCYRPPHHSDGQSNHPVPDFEGLADHRPAQDL